MKNVDKIIWFFELGWKNLIKVIILYIKMIVRVFKVLDINSKLRVIVVVIWVSVIEEGFFFNLMWIMSLIVIKLFIFKNW